MKTSGGLFSSKKQHQEERALCVTIADSVLKALILVNEAGRVFRLSFLLGLKSTNARFCSSYSSKAHIDMFLIWKKSTWVFVEL